MPKDDAPKKILIVDDDPFIVDMYVLKFKDQGFEVEIASDGKSGWEKVQKFAPDLILLDVVMPSVDGFDLLQKIKSGKSPAKIILLTNLGQKDDIEKGRQLGADDYLIKAHFTPTEIVDKAKEILGIKKN
ncbi:MAG: response regulator [Patescibacteria group bacterium]